MSISDQVVTDYAGAISTLETKFSSYLPSQVNPPDGIPAEIRTTFPHIFPGKWPLLAAAELIPEPGKPIGESDTLARLRALRVGVRIYYPSLSLPDRGDEWVDGRETAKRITRAVWSNWLAAFQADESDELLARASIARIDMGDHDKIGNPFYQPGTRQQTILWVHATEVVYLI